MLTLCPRCELNYITGSGPYCKVCMLEMQGRVKDEPELCSICNENPVLPGRDVCAACLSEMNAEREKTTVTEENVVQHADTEVLGEIEPVTEMEDILPDDKDQLGKEFSLIEDAMAQENEQGRQSGDHEPPKGKK